jgi:hypothetical protein
MPRPEGQTRFIPVRPTWTAARRMTQRQRRTRHRSTTPDSLRPWLREADGERFSVPHRGSWLAAPDGPATAIRRRRNSWGFLLRRSWLSRSTATRFTGSYATTYRSGRRSNPASCSSAGPSRTVRPSSTTRDCRCSQPRKEPRSTAGSTRRGLQRSSWSGIRRCMLLRPGLSGITPYGRMLKIWLRLQQISGSGPNMGANK